MDFIFNLFILNFIERSFSIIAGFDRVSGKDLNILLKYKL